MADLLDMDALNSLPQPFVARMAGGGEWEVNDIDVETGLMRLIVCGKLEVTHFGNVMELRDIDGGSHDPDQFYIEEAS